MKNIKVIIFDYDGVIAESVNVKTEAFAELYRPYGEGIVQQVIAHHEANGGISRFEKFRIYHNEFLGIQIEEKEIQQLADKFSNLVLQKVIDSPYVNGAYDFIRYNNKYDLYISTGTPLEEIRVILERKGIVQYFNGVFGSPEKKSSHVKKILDKYNYSKDSFVFIGDALTDRNAAKENGIEFIGRYTTTEEIKEEKYLVEDFRGLENILK